MDVLQICRQIELLYDLINKNESSIPIQGLSPDQVPLTAPYIESIPAQTHEA